MPSWLGNQYSRIVGFHVRIRRALQNSFIEAAPAVFVFPLNKGEQSKEKHALAIKPRKKRENGGCGFYWKTHAISPFLSFPWQEILAGRNYRSLSSLFPLFPLPGNFLFSLPPFPLQKSEKRKFFFCHPPCSVNILSENRRIRCIWHVHEQFVAMKFILPFPV